MHVYSTYFACLWSLLGIVYLAAALCFYRRFKRTRVPGYRSNARVFLGAAVVMAIFDFFAVSGFR
jgi:hypothetical protein